MCTINNSVIFWAVSWCQHAIYSGLSKIVNSDFYLNLTVIIIRRDLVYLSPDHRTLVHSTNLLYIYLWDHPVPVVVQALSLVGLFVTPWTAAPQASLSFTNSQSLHKLMSIESVTPSNHLILCRPLLLPPSIFPSIRVFSSDSVLHIRWPRYCISPSNEYSGLISFRMDWFDLLAVQGTLKSSPTPRFKSIHSLALSFTVQLSHPYMTTGKIIALTRRTCVGQVISVLFNTLSRLVITFLLKSKRLLISQLRSPSAVILEPRKIVSHCFHGFPIYLPWSDGTGCHDLSFSECWVLSQLESAIGLHTSAPSWASLHPHPPL